MTRLVKTVVFFSLEDVLVPFKIADRVNAGRLKRVFSELSALEKKGGFNFFVLSGLTESRTKELAEKYALNKLIDSKKIFSVSAGYIHSKEDVDMQRHLDALKEDKWFKDDYFKQTKIIEYLNSNNVSFDKAVFICHDILTEAFYSIKFSKIDFALVRDSLSFRNEKSDSFIQGVSFISLDWPDIKKIISNGLPENNAEFLKDFVLEKLKEDLLSSELNKGLDKIGLGEGEV